jgi:predicted transcriptional regulator of viral defense system
MKYEKKPISKILRSNNTVFTFKDISLIWGDTDRKATISAINYYVKTGNLYRIRRGLYAKEKNYDKFELATKIYTPSYISFETVLSQAGVIFQFYSQIFVASYLTRGIKIDNQKYSYRKIKDSTLTNQAGLEFKDNYWMASPERAFLDILYLNKKYYFDNLDSLDKEKIFKILPIYKNKALEKRVKEIYGA